MKIYRDWLKTNLQGEKVAKENTSCKCLSLIMLDFATRVNKKYYPQMILEECKYEIKTTKMENLINNDLDSSPPDESDNGHARMYLRLTDI